MLFLSKNDRRPNWISATPITTPAANTQARRARPPEGNRHITRRWCRTPIRAVLVEDSQHVLCVFRSSRRDQAGGGVTHEELEESTEHEGRERFLHPFTKAFSGLKDGHLRSSVVRSM